MTTQFLNESGDAICKILTAYSRLIVHFYVILTTAGATSDDEFANVTIFPFQFKATYSIAPVFTTCSCGERAESQLNPCS